MVLQSSGAISLTNIQTEFGGTNPISISEYYARAINIPASGAIDFSDFYGAYAIAGRGVFGGGLTMNVAPAADTYYNTLDYITISTTGNATDFGDLVQSLRTLASCSSTTRGLFAGGVQNTPVTSYENSIRYITIATTGNATDFGDLTAPGRTYLSACSSSTRGVFGGGFTFPALPAGTTVNTMDYVTIATIGNATDFGDLSATKEFTDGACSSSTRGVFIGGSIQTPSTGSINTTFNTIDYITIATTGNSTNFGTITGRHQANTGACSSPSRGVFGGGSFIATAADAPAYTPGSSYYGPTTTEYFTIATTGNSTTFGNALGSRFFSAAASTSNSIRGVFGGGNEAFATPGATLQTNRIEYITISTQGTTTDFGDLTVVRSYLTACSDSDGGIVEAGGGGGGGGGSGRGLFAGCKSNIPLTNTNFNTIDYITISTTGNATDFGDLTVARYYLSGFSSSTRGVFGGGITPVVSTNTIDYVTIATTGNATNFGSLSVNRYGYGSCSNSTRGLFGAGLSMPATTNINTIDYITIATTGNATNFGSLTAIRSGVSGCSSPTRGVFGGGYEFVSQVTYNIIEYVTIATTGNATDFGDLTLARSTAASCSSSTRGVFAGGGAVGGYSNTIDYITITTTGNATDFGDLSVTRTYPAGSSNSTRGVFGGGSQATTPVITYINTIDYITIATTSNATDFGDLSIARGDNAGCSDSHGGLA
jgi:hypothetical protein